MGQMRGRGRIPLVSLAAIALAACGSGGAASTSGSPATVGNVGELPGTLPTSSSAPSTVDEPSSSSGDEPFVAPPEDGGRPPLRAGEIARGNRLLLLGDSVLEATSTRYGGEMCARLVPHGWAVEIDAENGRDAGVGLQVLEDRLDEGEEWDAAVVMLGNNYRKDPQQLDQQIEAILDRLAPMPVILLTVTEFEEAQAEVNYVLRTEAANHEEVDLLEWAERTAHDDSLVGADGLHLSEHGKVALTAMVRLALGDAPAGSVGECLDA
jgi:lysophospholipase L1-like esterase